MGALINVPVTSGSAMQQRESVNVTQLREQYAKVQLHTCSKFRGIVQQIASMIENETPRQLTPAPASTIVKHLTASNRILSTGDSSVE